MKNEAVTMEDIQRAANALGLDFHIGTGGFRKKPEDVGLDGPPFFRAGNAGEALAFLHGYAWAIGEEGCLRRRGLQQEA